MTPWGNALADILNFVQTDVSFRKAAISILVVLISMFMIYLCRILREKTPYLISKVLIDAATVLIFVQAVLITIGCPFCWLGFSH